jgi:protein-S-isoprenylcysteine O-methyltransferase Ste14
MTATANNTISMQGKIYVVRNMISVIISGIIFFLAAGRLDIFRGWIYFLLASFIVIVGNLIIGSHNPQLLHQRSKIHAGSKKWDKWWLVIFAIGFVYGMPFVAGWETGRLGNVMQSWTLIFGMILYIFSVIISIWAQAVNRFFEPAVRIQTERNHKVVTRGPYSWIRHPGYTGAVLWALAFPLIVGSHYALFQGFVLILFIALRTYLEDKTLLAELIGYREYAENVRYRLIPGLW